MQFKIINWKRANILPKRKKHETWGNCQIFKARFWGRHLLSIQDLLNLHSNCNQIWWTFKILNVQMQERFISFICSMQLFCRHTLLMKRCVRHRMRDFPRLLSHKINIFSKNHKMYEIKTQVKTALSFRFAPWINSVWREL